MPSHAWNRWPYHYPQATFPYAGLVAENGRRGRHDPEYELLDTGVFADDIPRVRRTGGDGRAAPPASPRGAGAAFGAALDEVLAARRTEADDFYRDLTPPAATPTRRS
jgi:hypothetical protein